MTVALKDWLLTCPEVQWISAIAPMAAAAGFFDLRPEMAKAISGGVRMASLGETPRIQPRAYYHRSARMLAHRRRGCYLALLADTLVLSGTIVPGVAIAQMQTSTVLYVRRSVPETIAVALPGRRVGDLIHVGRLDLADYLITAAEQDEWGLAIWFDVPRLAFGQFV